MADRTNTDMLILEFLSVTKPSRRREVKERLDALTKYDNSEFRARFRLSKLSTVEASMSHSSSAVLLQHNTIHNTEKISGNLQLLNTATIMNDTAMASANCSRP